MSKIHQLDIGLPESTVNAMASSIHSGQRCPACLAEWVDHELVHSAACAYLLTVELMDMRERLHCNEEYQRETSEYRHEEARLTTDVVETARKLLSVPRDSVDEVPLWEALDDALSALDSFLNPPEPEDA